MMTEQQINEFKPAEVSVVFEEEQNRSAAYVDNRLIGECEFSVSDAVWTIFHTGVRPAFEGKGIAKKLLLKVIEKAREKKVKIVPQCSYAEKVMKKTAEYQDVL